MSELCARIKRTFLIQLDIFYIPYYAYRFYILLADNIHQRFPQIHFRNSYNKLLYHYGFCMALMLIRHWLVFVQFPLLFVFIEICAMNTRI